MLSYRLHRGCLWRSKQRSQRRCGHRDRCLHYRSQERPIPLFVVSPKRQPTFHISGLDPNEEIRRKYGAVAYGWDAFGGVGLGLPQDAVRIKIG